MNPIFVNINVYKWNSYSAFECFCDLEVRKFLIVHIYRNRKIPYLSLLVYIAGCGNLLFVLMGGSVGVDSFTNLICAFVFTDVCSGRELFKSESGNT